MVTATRPLAPIVNCPAVFPFLFYRSDRTGSTIIRIHAETLEVVDETNLLAKKKINVNPDSPLVSCHRYLLRPSRSHSFQCAVCIIFTAVREFSDSGPKQEAGVSSCHARSQ